MTRGLPTAWQLGLDRRPDWILDALCGQILDDSIWYPDKGGSTRAAKAICKRCPVVAECLTYALANDEAHGVWGGFSTDERKQMRPRSRGRYELAPCGTEAAYTRHGRRKEPVDEACRRAYSLAKALRAERAAARGGAA